jgi:hypothetical protein
MKIELNPEMLKVSMDLWRKAVDMEIPLAREIRIHFFARRGELLDGFARTASNWSMLLRCCKATGDDLLALDALEEEVDNFKKWAENGIRELAQLARQELDADRKPG